MLRITENADITRHTTFGIKARARQFVTFDTADDLVAFFSANPSVEFLALGGGSNMLFVNGCYDGVLLHSTDKAVAVSEPDGDGLVTVTAAAGCVLDELCSLTASRGLWGLENLSGIPGTIGGAAVQNVGAYGTELKDCASEVICFDTTSLKEVTFPVEQGGYGYRASMFKHTQPAGRYIVMGVVFKLSVNPRPNLDYAALAKMFAESDSATLTPMQLREAVVGLRDSKLPSPEKTGSAGSFFKNPVVTKKFHDDMCRRLNIDVPGHVTPTGEVKLSAAWLIDHAGCKPLTCGGAALWQSQPLVLVNATGNATGHEVVELERMVCERVNDRFGVNLSPEVIHVS